MLKVQKYQTYEQKKEAIYKYRETHMNMWRENSKNGMRRLRAFQAQAKILRNILIAFFED
jgi:ribosome recycling factor